MLVLASVVVAISVDMISPAGEEPALSSFGLFDQIAEAVSLFPEIQPPARESMFDESAGGIRAALKECAASVSCSAERLRQQGYDLGIRAIAILNVDPPITSLDLIDAEQSQVAASAVVTISKNTEQTREEVKKSVIRLLTGTGLTLGARLTVEVTPPGSRIIVGETTHEGPTATMTLAPGTHAVTAESEGHSSETQTVTLLAGEDRRATLRLEPEGETILATWWFWTIVGAAAAGAAAGVIIVASSGPETYTITQPR